MPSQRRIKITGCSLQLIQGKTCADDFFLTPVLWHTIALKQCAVSAAKCSFRGNFFIKERKTILNCGTNMQESLAKIGKYHQEAIKILVGFLKAIGLAGFPLVQCSIECPGFVLREAQPCRVNF